MMENNEQMIRKRNASITKLTNLFEKTTNDNDNANDNDDDDDDALNTNISYNDENDNSLLHYSSKNNKNTDKIDRNNFIDKVFNKFNINAQNKYIKMLRKNFLKIFISSIVLTLIFIFVILPILIRNSIRLQRFGVFLNSVNLHYFYDLNNVKQFDFECAKSFYLSNNGHYNQSIIQLGVWHLFPGDEPIECSREYDDFNDDRLVFLYLHGNMGSRAYYHRRLLNKLLSEKFNAHVVAFDYRGFADSTNANPSTFGLTNDTKAVYEWIISNNVRPDRIIIWSHSLGTGVAARFLNECPDEIYPRTAIIEAGFTSISEASLNYPLIKIFSFLPYFEYCFVEPLITNPDLNFNSTDCLSNIRCPLLIMHAEDDRIVSYDLGRQLYEQAKQLQPKLVGNYTQFLSYPAHLGYGHQDIYLDPDLSTNVKNFLQSIDRKP